MREDTTVGPIPELPKKHAPTKLIGQQLLSAGIILGGVFLRSQNMLSEDNFVMLEAIGAAAGVTGASIVPALIDIAKKRVAP